jgi:outer membrane autotransporter protein
LAGTHDRSASVFGGAVGVNYRVTPDTRVGFALAGGGTNFGLSDNLGSGRSDMLQAAIYGRTYFNAAYVAAAFAYAWDRVSTDRFVTLAGTDHLTAAFSAYDLAGRVEGGYRFAVPNVLGLPGHEWLTPFAALQEQAFYAPAYSESAASGSPVFALAYAAHTTTTTRTELGARTEWTMPVDNGATLSLRTSTAWAHDHWSSSSVTAMFQSLPGSSFFTVNGAAPASDSLLALAGAEIRFKNGVAVAGWFDSELARRAQTYTGTARLSYMW